MLEDHGFSLQRSRTITDGVHDAVLAAIVKGDIKGGDELRDKDWATRFAVSRTPVREAFKRLEAHGLTDVAAARYTKVRTFTPREARQEAADWAALHGAVVRSMRRGAGDEFVEELKRVREAAQRAGSKDRDIVNFEFFELVRGATSRFGLRLAATAAAYRYHLVITSLPQHLWDDSELQTKVIESCSSDEVDYADPAFELWLSAQPGRLAAQ